MLAFVKRLFRRLFGRKRTVAETMVAVERPNRPTFIEAGRLFTMQDRVRPGQEAFPRFRASAADQPRGIADSSEIATARFKLREVFTPSQPVTERGNFAGRTATLAQLIDAIEEQRSHVVVYGERGIGKTSMMHVLADVAREARYVVIYGSCGAHSRFDELFRALAASIPLLYHSSVSPTTAEAEGGATLADRLPAGPFGPREFSDLCAEIVGTRVLIILDEYDRIEDPNFRQNVAELIKNLSDRAARVQLVIAGVSANLHELIGYISSIRRNVIGLPMPRMAMEEVRQLLSIGEQASGVRFDDPAIKTIGLLANGSPYLARLLSYHSSAQALKAGRMDVHLGDITGAIEQIVEEARGRISARTVNQVESLIVGERRICLRAAARAAVSPDGWFTMADVVPFIADGLGVDRCQTILRELTVGDGLIEADIDAKGERYRFREEGLPNYLWMLLATDQVELPSFTPINDRRAAANS